MQKDYYWYYCGVETENKSEVIEKLPKLAKSTNTDIRNTVARSDKLKAKVATYVDNKNLQ